MDTPTIYKQRQTVWLQVNWLHFQRKLFTVWALMRVMPKRLREFMQSRVGLQITH
jgi:hypothetical protein